MLDLEKIGRQIALLRKEKGLTGEKLAELLDISSQAVSKWENGRCLPETSLLPDLAGILGCSIDTLLVPNELVILDAVYTDGVTFTNATQTVNSHVRDNKLFLCVNEQFTGVSIGGDRLKLIMLKYQVPDGTYYAFALQNETLTLDIAAGQTNNAPFKLIGAYYGNAKEYVSAMRKMEHYEFFKWDMIRVDHETFPSNTASDDTEYLTLVYLNKSGIHAVSCAENDTLYYGDGRTSFYLKDNSKCILPDIMRLEWGRGMECPWAGSLYAALRYMGEEYTYEQIMGMSGACYRVCFTDIWDWSCTDALVAFDYATPLYKAVGYTQICADRLEKDERKAERLNIMRDLQSGKPVLAINLRIAPEWGVITGYIDNGKEFLCRTYFDKEIFDNFDDLKKDDSKNTEKIITFEERGGYLANDFWPFLIAHFGEKIDKPSARDILYTSLKTLAESFNAVRCRGYYQGKQAYEAWINGLSDDNSFDITCDKDNALRRMGVNESMMFNLIDARRAAEKYIRGSITVLTEENKRTLEKIADNYKVIHETLTAFYNKLKDCASIITAGTAAHELRREQIGLLETSLDLEQENSDLAGLLLSK